MALRFESPSIADGPRGGMKVVVKGVEFGVSMALDEASVSTMLPLLLPLSLLAALSAMRSAQNSLRVLRTASLLDTEEMRTESACVTSS